MLFAFSLIGLPNEKVGRIMKKKKRGVTTHPGRKREKTFVRYTFHHQNTNKTRNLFCLFLFVIKWDSLSFDIFHPTNLNIDLSFLLATKVTTVRIFFTYKTRVCLSVFTSLDGIVGKKKRQFSLIDREYRPTLFAQIDRQEGGRQVYSTRGYVVYTIVHDYTVYYCY